jgi:selenocysteine lyase/cysteine desulfurase
MIDVERARRETPGCASVLHFDNAGASLMPRPVLDALREYLDLESRVGGYRAGELMEERIDGTYDAAAALVGARRDEIAVVENATRAWDMAFYGIPFQGGDRILTGVNEYGSNYLAFLQMAERTGVTIDVVPDDDAGALSVEALERMIDDRVRLIALTHVPTNGGLVNPAAAVGRVAREAGVFYLLDACQSVGQLAVDVAEVGCDFLSATARKYVRGPRGVGFLYARHDTTADVVPPFIDIEAATWTKPDAFRIRPDARRFENWERNLGSQLAMGVAIEYAMGWGIDQIEYWVKSLADILRARLGEVPGVTVRDLGAERCGLVSFSVEGVDPVGIKAALAEDDIIVSVSTVNATRLDMERRGAESFVRASVHYFNTEAEIERFCRVLELIVR